MKQLGSSTKRQIPVKKLGLNIKQLITCYDCHCLMTLIHQRTLIVPNYFREEHIKRTWECQRCGSIYWCIEVIKPKIPITQQVLFKRREF